MKSLRLQNFRCYDFFDLDNPQPLHISQYQDNWMHISGPNGAGKTSILEAISLLIPGRGIRKAAKEDLIYIKSQEQWCASFTFYDRKLMLSPCDKGRKITDSSGERRWYQDIVVFWITPQSTAKFFSSKTERRYCLDKWIGGQSNAYHKSHINYQKAYMHWLKCCKNQYSAASFENILTQEGNAIINFRKAWAESLHFEKPLNGIVIDESIMETDWQTARQLGIAHGPHRADLRLVGRTDHHLASTGEQKLWLFLLICRLLEQHHASTKILLLDDWSENFDIVNRNLIQEKIKSIQDIQVISSGVT